MQNIYLKPKDFETDAQQKLLIALKSQTKFSLLNISDDDDDVEPEYDRWWWSWWGWWCAVAVGAAVVDAGCSLDV